MNRSARESGHVPLGFIASVIIAVLIVSGTLAADLLAPYDPLEQDVGRRLVAPGAEHLFGTDGFGRDVFSRTLHGGRMSIIVALSSVFAAGAAGTAIGTASAYAGGRLDIVVQRAVDLLLGFPFLVMALLVVVAISPSAPAVAGAIAISLVPLVTRVARSAALSVANEEYVLVVRSTGAGAGHIMIRHILPAAGPPIVAYLATCLGAAIAAEATLSFLGLGLPPPYPSWGRMLQEGSRAYFDAAPWVTLLPGLVLSLTVVSVTAIGDRLGRRRVHTEAVQCVAQTDERP